MTQISRLVSDHLREHEFDSDKLADLLAQKAFDYSLDEEFDSPFAQEARRSGYEGAIGGKSDDISVTVGRVRLAGDAPKNQSKPSEVAADAAVTS